MKKSLGDLKSTGKNLLGIFIQSASPELVEIAGYTGFDFVVIDTEHSPTGIPQVVNLVRAAEAADILSLVRLPDINDGYIKKILDMGAAGIIVPNVGTAEQAERAVELSKFSPDGTRGACPGSRANQYGLATHEYYEKSNRETSVVVLVETAEAIRNFEEIISVPGIDAVFLGPVDLSVDMGFGGDVNNPIVLETLFRMIKIANTKGVFIGIMSMDVASAQMLFKKGVNFVVYGIDTLLFYDKCKETVEKIFED